MTNDIRQCDELIAHFALRADHCNLIYAEAVMMEGFILALSKVGSKTATDLVSAVGILQPVAALAPRPH